MNKFNVFPTVVVRFVVLAGILFFCIASLNYAAMSCPTVKGMIGNKVENVDTLTEEFSFLMQDFKITHQSEDNILNINIRFCYENGISDSKYPDFRAILNDIQDFLTNYPNEVDYWEIVNKNITQMVLKKYPMLSSVTSEIQVSPSRLTPYIRSSIATRYQSKIVKTNNKKTH